MELKGIFLPSIHGREWCMSENVSSRFLENWTKPRQQFLQAFLEQREPFSLSTWDNEFHQDSTLTESPPGILHPA